MFGLGLEGEFDFGCGAEVVLDDCYVGVERAAAVFLGFAYAGDYFGDGFSDWFGLVGVDRHFALRRVALESYGALDVVDGFADAVCCAAEEAGGFVAVLGGVAGVCTWCW